MSAFEERLWQELVGDHSDALMHDPLPRRRRRAPALAAAAALAAALAAVLLWLGGGAGQPAYAITQHPDGTITITIRKLVGVQAADAKLAQLGVSIRTVASEAGCRASGSDFPIARVSPRTFDRIRRIVGPGAASVKVQPAAIPAGDTLLLAAQRLGNGTVGLREALYKGSAPSCVPPPTGASR